MGKINDKHIEMDLWGDTYVDEEMEELVDDIFLKELNYNEGIAESNFIQYIPSEYRIKKEEW